MIESDEIVGGERGELSCRVSAFSLGIFSPLFLSLSLSLFFCLLFLFVVVCLLKKECGASLNSISRCEMRPTGAVGMPTTPLTFRRPIRHRSFRRERKEETVAPQQKKKEREREKERENNKQQRRIFPNVGGWNKPIPTATPLFPSLWLYLFLTRVGEEISLVASATISVAAEIEWKQLQIKCHHASPILSDEPLKVN